MRFIYALFALAVGATAVNPIDSLLEELSSLTNYKPSSIPPSRYLHSQTGQIDNPNNYEILAQGITELLEDNVLLADLVFRAPPPFTHDTQLAFNLYKQLADEGDPTAHSILGFLHDTGYNNVVEPHPGLALLHYTFAALAGDTISEMTLGYKHSIGSGAEQSCEQAVEWYSRVADKAIDYYLSGPPGGHSLPLSKPKLSDLKGGPYGLGASVASTGENAFRPVIYAGKAKDSGENWHDLLDYFTYAANQGELQYTIRLGNIYYHGSVYTPKIGPADGSGAIAKDFKKAKYWFTRATRKIWPEGLQSDKQKEVSKYTKYLVSMAATSLGKMYLRGEGFESNNYISAFKWLERARDLDSAEAEYYLGIMYRDGYHVGVDLKKASAYFTSAASNGYPEAYVALGNAFLERNDIVNAIQNYEWAVNISRSFEGTYRLATLTRDSDCQSALAKFKSVAERGDWTHGDKVWKEANSRWEKANEWNRDSYGRNEAESALLTWWRMAERGYESAQNNVAYILDQDKQAIRLPRFDRPANDTLSKISLGYWEKSAEQNVLDSRIKAADYYFRGLGTDVNYEKAAALYLNSADTHSSALALWNVGWMYEHGKGLPMDYNLAKRYYDMALEVNNEAFIPVAISLIHLYAKSIWGMITGKEDSNVLFNNIQKAGTPREREEMEDRQSAQEAVNRVDWTTYEGETTSTQREFVDGLLERNALVESQDGFESTTFIAVIMTIAAGIYLRRQAMARARQRTVDRLTEEITRRAHDQAGHTQPQESDNSENVQNNQNENNREQELRQRNTTNHDYYT
ncbi:hypothetical protein E3Q24_02686 [Wallemia mellicola]|nr:hypothetical protein E3Q24_02686 [Wallemia mellicola]